MPHIFDNIESSLLLAIGQTAEVVTASRFAFNRATSNAFAED